PVLIPAANSVNAPAVVRRPIRPPPPNSVNQRLPSGPVVISSGVVPTRATASVMTPAGVIRPIRLKFASVNQRLPSGPVVIPRTWPRGERPAENSVMTPAGVMRPIAPGTVLLLGGCVNQRLPSGPAVMRLGAVPGVMPAENSVTTPAGVIRPILF